MLIPPIPPYAVVASAERFPAVSVQVVAERPEITREVRAEFLAWQRGSIDRSRYSTYAAAQFTDPYVQRYAAQLREWGDLGTVEYVGKNSSGGTTMYDYRLVCANAVVMMQMGIDQTGKIDAIAFRGMKRRAAERTSA